MNSIVTETQYLASVLPVYFHIGMFAAYLLIGALLWSRFVYKWEAEEGLSDHLVLAERTGTRTIGETVALIIVKLAFYLLWPLFLVLLYSCKLIGFLQRRKLRTAV